MNVERGPEVRSLREEHLAADLAIVGGGLSGVCCAITAARQNLQVILVQDRPVLGGNASSEVRLWVLGATSHMGNNNRWAREGGVIDEILVENMWRNPEGNSVLFDAILLEMVKREPGIHLLLNTAVDEVEMAAAARVGGLRAYCSQNQTRYRIAAPLFVDASGDGVLGYLAGAEFRMGSESQSEFQEDLAGPHETRDLLGHSLYFYTRDTGKPVQFIAPAFALTEIEKIPRYRDFRSSDSGCKLWWLEYGGHRDTVFETEEIKWELWSVAYGVWNYIKNSGKFPEAANLTIEWMGTIPGKRESRRFLGDVMLTQNDIVQQRTHADAVSFGGWAIDLHPSDGVYSRQPGCTQWHAKGVYQIPFRTMYSRTVENLFLAGRLIGATHIAFGSTRVMATCAHNGQAVGMAAALCREAGVQPRELLSPAHMHSLQQRLLRAGQHIPGVAAQDRADFARQARFSASSTLRLAQLPSNGELAARDKPYALLLPYGTGPVPAITLYLKTAQSTKLHAELWRSSRQGNTTPDVLLASLDLDLHAGELVPATLRFPVALDAPCHLFVIVPPMDDAQLYLSQALLPGILTVSQKMNADVAKSVVQTPPEGSGVDTFAFWLPDRRPAARNLAATFQPPLEIYEARNVINGFARPWCGANAWVPELSDPTPQLHLRWESPQSIHVIELAFDTDFDHPMESVLMTHPERVMPGCIRAFRITSLEGLLLAEIDENHHTRRSIRLAQPVFTAGISIQIMNPGASSSAIFEVRCY